MSFRQGFYNLENNILWVSCCNHQAFEKAWKDACSSGSVLIVPENKNYLLKQITFSGPCKSDLRVKVRWIQILQTTELGPCNEIFLWVFIGLVFFHTNSLPSTSYVFRFAERLKLHLINQIGWDIIENDGLNLKTSATSH